MKTAFHIKWIFPWVMTKLLSNNLNIMKYILPEQAVKFILDAYLEDKGKFVASLDIKSYSLLIHSSDIYLSVYFYADNEPFMKIIPLDMKPYFCHH